jgi:hypothetical protein
VIVPSVDSAVKFGASSPSVNAIVFSSMCNADGAP